MAEITLKKIIFYISILLFGIIAIHNIDFNSLYSPDSAEFSVLAKAIVKTNSYNDISEPNNPPHTKYPFGYPLLLTPSAFLSDNPFVYLILCKVTTLICAICALYGVYLLFENIFIVFLLAFTPVFFLFSTNVMSEVPLLCFNIWSIYFIKKIFESNLFNEGTFAKKILCSLIFALISAINYYIRGNGITMFPTIAFYILLLKNLKPREKLTHILFITIFLSLLVLPWVMRDIKLSKTGRTAGENYVSQILTPFENPFQKKLDINLFLKRVKTNTYYYSNVIICHIFPSFNKEYSGVENYTLIIGLPKIVRIFFLLSIIFFLIYGIYFHIRKKGIDLFILFPLFFALLLIIFTYRQHRYFISIIPFTYYFVIKGISEFKFSKLIKYAGYFVLILISILNLFSSVSLVKLKGESVASFINGYIDVVAKKDDVLMAPPHIYLITQRKSIPFDPKCISVADFEYVIIAGNVKYIIADAWLGDLTEFDTLIYSSRLYDFKKLISIPGYVIFEVKPQKEKERKKRISEEIDYKAVIKRYEDAYKYLKGIPEFHNTLGYFYYKADIYDKAIDEFKKAVEIEPADHIFHFNLGTAYLNNGEYSKALDEYEIVRKCEFGYTIQHVLNKNIEIAVIKQNIEADPLQSGTAYNYFEVAKLWFERGSYKKAINELKTALKLSPDFYEAKLLLGMCYEATFKYNEAKKIYKELLKKGHNHQIEERLKEIEK